MLRRRGLLFEDRIAPLIKPYPELCYDGTLVKCLSCSTNILCFSSSNIKRHIQSKRHNRNKESEQPYELFLYDLLFAFSVCNISMNVLNNEHLHSFWKKYIPQWTLPIAEMLRRQFPFVRCIVENSIRKELCDKKVWITVDETTDRKNNKVVNVLVRALLGNQPTMPYLIASKRLEDVNAKAIQSLVMQSVEKFCIKANNIVMLVSDGTVHMIEAVRLLKQFYPNLLHITCLLSILHAVTEIIQSNYHEVDILISSTKKVFLKSSHHIKYLHSLCPRIPEPPQPIFHWGGWLSTAFYYNKSFHPVKFVVFKFDPKESKAVEESQQQFDNPCIETDLQTIEKNYSVVMHAIDKLQNTSASIFDSFEIVDCVNMSLQSVTDSVGLQASAKFIELLNRNPDFLHLRHIKECLNNSSNKSDLQYFTYANITCLDVEWSFSNYNALFSDKRTRLKETTIESILMMQAYARSHYSLPVI